MQASGGLPRVVAGDAALDVGGRGPGGLDSPAPPVETAGISIVVAPVREPPDPPVGGGGFAAAGVGDVVTRLASAFEAALLSTGFELVSVAGWMAPVAVPVPSGTGPPARAPAPCVVPVAGPVVPAGLPVAPPAVPGVAAGVAPVAPALVPVVVVDPPATTPVVPEAGVALGLPVEEPAVAGVAGGTLGATAPCARPLEHMTANAAPRTMNVPADVLRLWRRHGEWLFALPTGRPSLSGPVLDSNTH
jgi:hypothetical protein